MQMTPCENVSKELTKILLGVCNDSKSNGELAP